MSRRTRKPQTAKRLVGRFLLVQAIKITVFWLISKAMQRSQDLQERITALQDELEATDRDYSQVLAREADLRRRYGQAMDLHRRENEARLKAAGFGQVSV